MKSCGWPYQGLWVKLKMDFHLKQLFCLSVLLVCDYEIIIRIALHLCLLYLNVLIMSISECLFFTANEATKHIGQILWLSNLIFFFFFDISQSTFWFRCSQRYSKGKVISFQMCLFVCVLAACRSDQSRFFLVCISHLTHAITCHCLWDKKYFDVVYSCFL